ncbi:hypothetical protein [Nocardia sp. NPDC049707]|uniref:hypothetical protein n=1 Tax=Nocardia sp. NPDC049707 TaxID=3154735 RepID=UPI00341F21DC
MSASAEVGSPLTAIHKVSVGDEPGWVDDVPHRLMPIVMIVDWVLARVARYCPSGRTRARLVCGVEEPGERRSDLVVE